MSADFTPELCQLMNYVARVGCAIRMLSAEAMVCKGCTLPGYPDPEGQDVRWLADSIHNLDALTRMIADGDMRRIIQECRWRLEGFEEYKHWVSLRSRRWTQGVPRRPRGQFRGRCECRFGYRRKGPIHLA